MGYEKGSGACVCECGPVCLGPFAESALTLSLCLLGNEYPRAHQLQEERHVLGRGGEALPQGPGDCPLQRAPHVKGRAEAASPLPPNPAPCCPGTSIQTRRSRALLPPPLQPAHTSPQSRKGEMEDGLLTGLLKLPHNPTLT